MQLAFKLLTLGLCLPMMISAAVADAIESRTLLSARQNNIISAMGDIGYSLTALDSPEGSAILEDSQKRFVVVLGKCTKSFCKLVQTRACFVTPNASPELANRWNRNQMFGRAAMQSEGVMCLDNTAFVPNGLVSIAQLRFQIEGLIEVRPAVEAFFAKG